MKYLFIPYELAVIAKEKGFDEECFARYIKDSDEINFALCAQIVTNTYYGKADICSDQFACVAPLYQQIVDWVRDKSDLMIEITFGTESKFIYVIRDVKNGTSWAQIVAEENFNSYYEALNKAIEEALKLI